MHVHEMTKKKQVSPGLLAAVGVTAVAGASSRLQITHRPNEQPKKTLFGLVYPCGELGDSGSLGMGRGGRGETGESRPPGMCDGW